MRQPQDRHLPRSHSATAFPAPTTQRQHELGEEIRIEAGFNLSRCLYSRIRTLRNEERARGKVPAPIVSVPTASADGAGWGAVP